MGSYFYEQSDAAYAAKILATRVLIIGNDTAAAATLCATLRTAGHAAVAVATASEALMLCATQTFQLAIIDERICGLGGVQLARALRDAHGIPAVFLSSSNDPALISAAIKVGSLGLIVKPLDSTRLLPALQHVLSRAQELRELHIHAIHPQASTSKSIPPDSLMKRLRRWHQQAFTITSKLLNAGNPRDDFYSAIARSRKVRQEQRARRLDVGSKSN